MRKETWVLLLAFLVFAVAASAQPAPVRTIYAGGLSYNGNGTPAIAGTGLYAHSLNEAGTYAFTAIDALPANVKPFTVTTNVAVGVAQKIATIGGYNVFTPVAAGFSFNGTNAGWNWNGGAMIAIPLKSHYYILPSVRFLKTNVGGATGVQPIVGILFGFGS